MKCTHLGMTLETCVSNVHYTVLIPRGVSHDLHCQFLQEKISIPSRKLCHSYKVAIIGMLGMAQFQLT